MSSQPQPLAEAAHLAQKIERSTAKLSDVSGREFDYVVAGGGASGLALASRLAEDLAVTVAVLEAGGETHQFESITRPAQYGREHGNPELVYPYETEVQTRIGRSLMWQRGRGLGGSSAVNFMVFQNPPRGDIDNWENLGNPGWNWERYHNGVKRAETFHPTKENIAESFGFQQISESHGSTGPIHTSFSKIQTAGEAEIRQSLLNNGVKIAKDSAGGDITGLGSFVNSIDPRTNTRSYAATGYFLDKAHQPNLHVLTNATARKILFNEKKTSDQDLEATGVEFEFSGEVHTVRAKREVVLCAGALRSSALLELSGIGKREILSRLGIETLVDNPNVGENVQEHLIAGLVFLLDTEKGRFQTIDQFADPEFAAEQVKLYAEGKGLCLTQVNCVSWLPLSQISTPSRTAELIASAKARVERDLASPGHNRPGLREQYELQLKALEDDSVPDAAIIVGPFAFPAFTGEKHPGKPAVSLTMGLNHPFSRGSIHIKSADPNDNARMDPNIFDHDIDLELLVETFKFSRKLADTEPFKGIILKETAPGAGVISDEEIRKYIRENIVSTWHTAGSCALRPRDAGGVVDSSLKVYGTKNVRVGDISIIPLHIAAHTQAAAYSIAEQLAEILKNEAAKND